jgi:hypothetical protein
MTEPSENIVNLERGATSRIDDGSKCAESMTGEHCGHYYYAWHPKTDGNCTHDGPHCCYCDNEPNWSHGE